MPALKTRVPFTIKIAISIWLIFMALQALAIAAMLADAQINPLELAWRAAVFCGLGYQIYAASRLSRWSLVVHTLVYGSVTVRRYLHDPDWTQRYPILGVFVDIIPWAAVALLVAVHWRKLNWFLLGPAPERAQAEYIEHKRFESPDGLEAVTLEKGDHGLCRFVTWKFYAPAPESSAFDGPAWMLDEFSGLYATLLEAETAARSQIAWLRA